MAASIYDGASPLARPFGLFLMQIVTIVALARGLGLLLSRIRQPMVIAELLGGIILGPSVLGRIPGFTNTLFPTESLPTLELVAQLSLVLYMFILGMQMDLEDVRRCGRHAFVVSLIGNLVPLAVAFPLSLVFTAPEHYANNQWLFAFYLGLILGHLSLACAGSDSGRKGTAADSVWYPGAE